MYSIKDNHIQNQILQALEIALCDEARKPLVLSKESAEAIAEAIVAGFEKALDIIKASSAKAG